MAMPTKKTLFMGEANAGKTFVDYLGHNESQVTIDENGNGLFLVGPGSVSVWVDQESI